MTVLMDRPRAARCRLYHIWWAALVWACRSASAELPADGAWGRIGLSSCIAESQAAAAAGLRDTLTSSLAMLPPYPESWSSISCRRAACWDVEPVPTVTYAGAEGAEGAVEDCCDAVPAVDSAASSLTSGFGRAGVLPLGEKYSWLIAIRPGCVYRQSWAAIEETCI